MFTHCDTHPGNNNLSCRAPNIETITNMECEEHTVTKHNKRIQKNNVDKTKHVDKAVVKSSCLCEGCGKTFENTRRLKHHMITHSKERPFVCKVCSFKSFSINFTKKLKLFHVF